MYNTIPYIYKISSNNSNFNCCTVLWLVERFVNLIGLGLFLWKSWESQLSYVYYIVWNFLTRMVNGIFLIAWHYIIQDKNSWWCILDMSFFSWWDEDVVGIFLCCFGLCVRLICNMISIAGLTVRLPYGRVWSHKFQLGVMLAITFDWLIITKPGTSCSNEMEEQL